MQKQKPKIDLIKVLRLPAFLLTWVVVFYIGCTTDAGQPVTPPAVETELSKVTEVAGEDNVEADPKNFITNPNLDAQIGLKVEREAYSVVMNQADKQQKLISKNGVAKLNLEGALMANGRLPEGASFFLKIYSNRTVDFETDQPLLDIPVNLKALKDDAFPFQLNLNLRLVPGLYYYMIVEKGNTEPIFVQKFEVALSQ